MSPKKQIIYSKSQIPKKVDYVSNRIDNKMQNPLIYESLSNSNNRIVIDLGDDEKEEDTEILYCNFNFKK